MSSVTTQKPAAPAMVQPASTPLEAVALDVDPEAALCVVCYDNVAGAKLQPCGHDYFCEYCAGHFRTCPLCRQPVNPRNAEADNGVSAPRHRSVLSESEVKGIWICGLLVWVFIFIGGWIEWAHDVPSGCGLGGAEVDEYDFSNHSSYDDVMPWAETCKNCRIYDGASDGACFECETGLINGGHQCFEHLEDLPPVKTGAALGASTYLALIIALQVAGGTYEVSLIHRLRKLNMLPTKEFIVLASALFIEVARMFLVDAYVLQEFFGDNEYSIFRAPLECDEHSLDEATCWLGGDAKWYKYANATTSAAGPNQKYYIAAREEAFHSNPDVCSVFTSDSALLDYTETSGTWGNGGHPRFSRVGWVIGGEFAMYYFFATFINEVADNMFVIPTTTKHGWRCKIFSVALELFQLGALCPAAIFTHSDCLHYTDPLGVSLSAIRDIVVTFGYSVWAFVFAMLPLALVGLALLASLGLVIFIAATLARPLGSVCGQRAASRLQACQEHVVRRLGKLFESFKAGALSIGEKIMLLSFLPLFLGGMFLGTLVVVGQASKRGSMQVLTAVVLLSDVLFKILATMVMETGEYLLHRRVCRAVERREGLAQGQTQDEQTTSAEVEEAMVEEPVVMRASSPASEKAKVVGRSYDVQESLH